MTPTTATAIFVCGLPGSGKTYFAKHLAQAIGAAYFSSDILRKTIAPQRSYSPTEKAQVYAALKERLDHALRSAQTSVVDATFYQEALRHDFASLVNTAQARQVWIEVQADERIIQQRLSAPREDSEANWEVYQRLRDGYQPFSWDHLVLRSDQLQVGEMIARAKQWITEAP